jgi:hypothetical protein
LIKGLILWSFFVKRKELHEGKFENSKGFYV